MKKYQGKLFGAALGFSFGGPIGALIGAAIGHFFDTGGSTKVVHYTKNSEKELAFITSLILLLTGTAKADKEVCSAEVETIKTFFRYQLGYGGQEFLLIERIIQESFQKETVLSEACASIVGKTSYEERLFLIRLNYQVAVSDGRLSKSEEEFIRHASKYLGISEFDYLGIRNSFVSYKKSSDNSRRMPLTARDPYTLLGLTPDCINEEVHKAYRNLANKYHPDKVSHLGREFIDLATKRFTDINEAYEKLKTERGLS